MIPALTLTFLFLYVLFLFWCLYQWKRIRAESDTVADEEITVAVVIPMRNETRNIMRLLNSIQQQKYKKFEVVLCDDHSTDNTVPIVRQWISENGAQNFSLIHNDSFSKKEAITKAIQSTRAELIITTDADCMMKEHWISSIVSHYVKSKSVLIVGPVIIDEGSGLFQKLQSVEYAGLTAMSAASVADGNPMFCSGANLAFSRNVFVEVNGYAGSKSVSGDDTQLLMKVGSKYRGRISFLKNVNSIVVTNPSPKQKDFFDQRKRWASKVPNTLSAFTITIAVLAWLVHLFFLIGLVYSVFTNNYESFLIFWFAISLAEFILLNSIAVFVKTRIPFLLVLIAQPLYALYITIVGAVSPFGSFEWKGRSVKA